MGGGARVSIPDRVRLNPIDGWAVCVESLNRPLSYRRRHPMNPDNLRPAMTLAMKYNIISIKDDIVAKMMADWPSSLHEWDDWEYGIQQLQTRYDHFCESIRDHVPEPASAIRFALDFHIPAILPAAFYVLSRTDVMHDWYQDGNDEYKCWGNWRYSARWKDLSAQDLLCLIRGQRSMLGCWQKLDLAWEKMYPDLPPEVGPECTCSDAKGESTWQKIMSSVRDCSDIFHKLKELSSEDAIEGDACGLCKTVMTWAIQRSRRQLWDQLPSVFSLDQLIDH